MSTNPAECIKCMPCLFVSAKSSKLSLSLGIHRAKAKQSDLKMIHFYILRLLFLFHFVSPGAFSPLKGIDIQTGLSEYQWPLLMQFSFSHLGCCPVSLDKNCFCPQWQQSWQYSLRIQSNECCFSFFTKHFCDRFWIFAFNGNFTKKLYLWYLYTIPSNTS